MFASDPHLLVLAYTAPRNCWLLIQLAVIARSCKAALIAPPLARAWIASESNRSFSACKAKLFTIDSTQRELANYWI